MCLLSIFFCAPEEKKHFYTIYIMDDDNNTLTKQLDGIFQRTSDSVIDEALIDTQWIESLSKSSSRKMQGKNNNRSSSFKHDDKEFKLQLNFKFIKEEDISKHSYGDDGNDFIIATTNNLKLLKKCTDVCKNIKDDIRLLVVGDEFSNEIIMNICNDVNHVQLNKLSYQNILDNVNADHLRKLLKSNGFV